MPKIKKILTKSGSEDGVRPVLVDFQNGKIQPGQESRLYQGIFHNKQENKKLVGLSDGNMLYNGAVSDHDLYNNFLILPDSTGKKVQIIQVDYSVLAPQFEKNKVVSPVNAKNYRKSIIALHKEFGSKKSKRHTEQKERLTMNIDTVKAQLEKTVAELEVTHAPVTFTKQSDTESLYLPTIHRDAESREYVYVLHEIVPEDVLKSLDERSTEVFEADSLDSFGFFPSIIKNIQSIQSSDMANQIKYTKCNILLYCNCLIKFLVTPLRSLTKHLLNDYSHLVNNHIRTNFAVSGKGALQRPQTMKDKTACFLMVLMLIAADYELNLENVAKDTKISLKKMQEFGRALALSASNKGKNILTLKLPLPAPISSPLKRKRK